MLSKRGKGADIYFVETLLPPRYAEACSLRSVCTLGGTLCAAFNELDTQPWQHAKENNYDRIIMDRNVRVLSVHAVRAAAVDTSQSLVSGAGFENEVHGVAWLSM